MVDINEVLEICKLKYPLGSEVISCAGVQSIINDTPYIYDRDSNIISVRDQKGGERNLYYNGKFAEIISTPEIQPINDFSVW